MARSCPECGESTEFSSRSVEVLEGTCEKGHRTVLLAGAPDAAQAAVAGAAERAPAPCWDCGAELKLVIEPGRRVRAECAACGRTTLLLEGDEASEGGAPVPGRLVVEAESEEDDDDDDEDDDEEDDRPPRPRRPPFRPPSPGGRRPGGGFGPRQDRPFRPAARPCRQCGGPLSFEENQDGTLTGRCGSCGNTFVMRPREQQSRGPGGFGRRPGWGGRPSGPPRYSSGPPRRWRRDSDSEDPRRRRRRDD